MPFQNLADGLHLLRQRSQSKEGVYHYGVLDVGNRLNRYPAWPYHQHPVVIHQSPPTIRADWLRDTGVWEHLGLVEYAEEAGAIARIMQALQDPLYDLFGNNCEHFARFVTTGRRESTQVNDFVGIVLFVVAGVVVVKLAEAA
jgi:hypothetical protein